MEEEMAPQGTRERKNFVAALLNGRKPKAADFALPATHLDINPAPGYLESEELDDLAPEIEDENMEEEEQENFVVEAASPVFSMPEAPAPQQAAPRRIQAEPFKQNASNIWNVLMGIPADMLITIDGAFGTLSFKAINIAVSDDGVALMVKKDTVSFRPAFNSTLTITCDKEVYQVIYAGGFFTFKDLPLTLISFLRISEDPTP